MDNWAIEELYSLELGDKRLNKRCTDMLKILGDNPSDSIPVSCRGWKELIASYRFFDNYKVSLTKILSAHKTALLGRMKVEPILLVVQDTTSLDYTSNRSSEEYGHIESSSHRGLFLHPSLIVTPDKIPLGVWATKLWSRSLETLGKKHQRKQLPIEEKESYRWLESYSASCELANELPEQLIINVGDRENDIYEVFLAGRAENNKAEILVRCAQNRRVILEDNERGLLWKEVEQAPVLGKFGMYLSKTNSRKARYSTLKIQSKKVELIAPYRKGKKLENTIITAVLVRETKVPEGIEPVEWLLLTTLDVNNYDEAVKILEYYVCRWQIEVYFRTLKTGCKVEELQLENSERIENALALYMIVAWRILYMVMIGRKCPNIPADVIFDKHEWEILYITNDKKTPDKPPKLYDVLVMVAELGGYQNRKSDPPPGPQSLWIGLRRLVDYAFVYRKLMEK